MSDKKARFSVVAKIAGAFMAFSIGSGFATGQELLQFFAGFGAKGIMGTMLTMSIFIFFSIIVYIDCKKFGLKDAGAVYAHYAGKTIGKFISIFASIYIYCLIILMLAGSGATIEQYFGLNTYVGRGIMAVLVIVSAVLGLKKLFDIISKIGPLIILFLLIVTISSLFNTSDGFAAGNKLVLESEVITGASAWYIAACLYFTLCFLMLIPFLAGIPATMPDVTPKELKISSFIQAVFVMGTAAMVVTAFICNFSTIYGKQAPTLALAQNLNIVLAGVFSIILLAGIYGTIAPLLCTISAQIAGGEKTAKYRIVCIVAGAFAFFGSGILPFDRIVNIVLQVGGWVGMIMVPCVLYTRFIGKGKHAPEK